MSGALTVTSYRKYLTQGFAPAENRAVVKLFKRDETTEGGIVLPGATKEWFQYGVVLDLGPSAAWPERVQPGWVLALRGPAFEGVMLDAGHEVGVIASDTVLGFMPPTEDSMAELAEWREHVPDVEAWSDEQRQIASGGDALPAQRAGPVGQSNG